MRAAVYGLALTLGVLGVTGCGGSDSSSASNVIHAGQVDIQLPAGWKVVNNHAVRPASATASGSSTPANDGAATGDTVPLAKEDPQTVFFKALSTFSGCLRDAGIKFIGAPDPSKPDSPTNDPDYLKGLGTCAAKSNIVQALKDEQKAQDALTPAQIEVQNKGYLKWRKCMISRGWGIPEPKPDSKGRLFSFGTGNQPPAFDPPPGQDILTSTDVQDCATQVQRETNQGR